MQHLAILVSAELFLPCRNKHLAFISDYYKTQLEDTEKTTHSWLEAKQMFLCGFSVTGWAGMLLSQISLTTSVKILS